jgi:hypothetical protein
VGACARVYACVCVRASATKRMMALCAQVCESERVKEGEREGKRERGGVFFLIKDKSTPSNYNKSI